MSVEETSRMPDAAMSNLVLVLTASSTSHLPLEHELRQFRTVVVGDSPRDFEKIASTPGATIQEEIRDRSNGSRAPILLFARYGSKKWTLETED
jgi:hypothetical protein